MTEHATGIAPMLPKDGGFGTLRTEIEGQAQAIHRAHPSEQPLSLNEEYAMSRTASQSILRILEEQGVVEAGILSRELAAEAEKDPLTNLVTLAVRYEHTHKANESDEPSEMAQLALAVDGTGQAAVAAVLGRKAALPTMFRARKEVLSYDNLEGSIAGDTLHVLLDEAEEVSLPEESQEPLAA